MAVDDDGLILQAKSTNLNGIPSTLHHRKGYEEVLETMELNHKLISVFDIKFLYNESIVFLQISNLIILMKQKNTFTISG